jgi:hypothetical protein
METATGTGMAIVSDRYSDIDAEGNGDRVGNCDGNSYGIGIGDGNCNGDNNGNSYGNDVAMVTTMAMVTTI